MPTKKADAPDEQPAVMPSVADEPAPKGATLDGLKASDEIEVIHPETGQRYGVSVAAYHDLYEPAGYKPVRQGDNTLLPGDPRAPKAEEVPADQPAPVVPGLASEGQPSEG